MAASTSASEQHSSGVADVVEFLSQHATQAEAQHASCRFHISLGVRPSVRQGCQVLAGPLALDALLHSLCPAPLCICAGCASPAYTSALSVSRTPVAGSSPPPSTPPRPWTHTHTRPMRQPLHPNSTTASRPHRRVCATHLDALRLELLPNALLLRLLLRRVLCGAEAAAALLVHLGAGRNAVCGVGKEVGKGVHHDQVVRYTNYTRGWRGAQRRLRSGQGRGLRGAPRPGGVASRTREGYCRMARGGAGR